MKLYYSKGACSLSPHIVLQELGLPHELIPVDFSAPSPDLLKANPMGAVPTLVMDNGEALTEGAAIVQYLADLKPEAKLAPKAGTPERVRLQEALNFIATEIHKGFSILFGVDSISKNPAAQEEIRTYGKNALGQRFEIINRKLENQEYFLPWGYSVADAYLFTVLTWSHSQKIDLSRWPKMQEYMDRVKSRPATQRALKAEHLI